MMSAQDKQEQTKGQGNSAGKKVLLLVIAAVLIGIALKQTVLTGGGQAQRASEARALKQMEPLLNDMYRDARQSAENYEKELNRIGWAGILDSQRIAQDADLAGSFALIKQAQEAFRRNVQENTDAVGALRGKIRALNCSDAEKKQLSKVADVVIEKARTTREQSVKYEESIFVVVESLFRHLQQTKGRWKIDPSSEEPLTFQEPAEQQRHQAILEKMQKITEEQTNFQQSVMEKGKAGLKEAGLTINGVTDAQ